MIKCNNICRSAPMSLERAKCHILNRNFWSTRNFPYEVVGSFSPLQGALLIFEPHLNSSQGQEGDHDRPHFLVLYVSLWSRRVEQQQSLFVCSRFGGRQMSEALKRRSCTGGALSAVPRQWHIVSAGRVLLGTGRSLLHHWTHCTRPLPCLQQKLAYRSRQNFKTRCC